jgi:hypothetical protein
MTHGLCCGRKAAGHQGLPGRQALPAGGARRRGPRRRARGGLLRLVRLNHSVGECIRGRPELKFVETTFVNPVTG